MRSCQASLAKLSTCTNHLRTGNQTVRLALSISNLGLNRQLNPNQFKNCLGYFEIQKMYVQCPANIPQVPVEEPQITSNKTSTECPTSPWDRVGHNSPPAGRWALRASWDLEHQLQKGGPGRTSKNIKNRLFIIRNIHGITVTCHKSDRTKVGKIQNHTVLMFL